MRTSAGLAARVIDTRKRSDTALFGGARTRADYGPAANVLSAGFGVRGGPGAGKGCGRWAVG